MSLTLEQLKANYKTPEKNDRLPNNYFPFWDMKAGQQAIVRFLPDANQNNPLGFLVEKTMHNLTIGGERKSVPCLKMYDQDCPICKVSAAYYKAEDKINGKKYWKKKQYIAQALVMEDPLPPDAQGESSEGKVRLITLGFSLYKIIKDAFESGDLEEIPYAYKGGTNFIIKKDMQGEYASYNLSKFSRKSTDLSGDVIEGLDLVDLSTLLPRNPGLEKVEAMLEADLSGTTLPASVVNSTSDGDVESEEDVEVVTTAASKPTPPPAQKSSPDSDSEAEQVLAQIRARRAAAKK